MEYLESGAPLRIIQVVNVRWFNATAWYGLFLSKLLRDAGHEVLVLGLGGTESFAKAEQWGLSPVPLNLNTANPARLAFLAGRLRGIVRDFRPHIVNCHRGESFFLWAALKLLEGESAYRLIRTRGDQRPPKKGRINSFMHTSLADAVIATSSSIAVAFRDRLRLPPERVHTVYGGVDTRVFYPDFAGRVSTRAALGLEPEDIAVGLVGRFDAVKGQKELIRAVAVVREALGAKANRLRLVLAGFATASTSEDDVRGWIRDAGMEGNVLLPGRRADVRGLLNALDLGVVASLGSETIARVALEIMACGVPLIGAAVGVMPDLLSPEALAEPGDEHGMAALLGRFLTEPEYGDRLRAEQAGRMRALSERDFLEETLAVYRQTLNRPGRRE